MSEQAARAFVERMKTDEAFRSRIRLAEDLDESLELIRGEGFDCSAEEIAAQASKLEETDLDGIAAGDSGSQEGRYDPWGILRYTQGYS